LRAQRSNPEIVGLRPWPLDCFVAALLAKTANLLARRPLARPVKEPSLFYREAGQYKTTYAADMAIFPIRQDRYGMALILFVAFVVIPAFGTQFLINSMMIPFLILSLSAIGLNLLTGYTGLLSLGTGAFMGVGAYACYKLETIFPEVNILVWIIVSGLVSALVGVVFGLPSLRIKGFYLAVATLAAQFFLEWCFARVPWLVNYNDSGAIEVPTETLFGLPVTGPTATPVTRYLVVLTIVAAMAWIASNIVHGRIGRMWMAVRDMDIAAELIGIRLLRAKLLAFAVSSFIIGVAGALMVFLWFGAAEAEAFNIDLSFQVLFMIIIGGLGSIVGAFFGAAVIYLMPIGLRALPAMLNLTISSQTIDQLTTMITGVLIIAFLIVEPYGLARLWQTVKQKLRVWPFPY
jgi:branched-chain amino acid transport system permease protein